MGSFSAILRRLFPHRGKSPRRRRSAGLLLESLETRCVPANVVYAGGPLIQHVQIEDVFYGAAWKTNTNLQNQVVMFDTMAKWMVESSYGSSYLNLISQYSGGGQTIGYGSFLGHAYVNSPPMGNTVDDTQIQNMLSWEIGQHVLVPNSSYEVLYLVYMEPGRVVTQGGQDSVNDFYGYHNQFTDANGKPITYAVMPYSLPPNVTDQYTAFQDMTQTASHEIVEAITDPDTNTGWRDPGGAEVADLGGSGIEFNKNFFLQLEWSNAANGTAVSANGTLTQPPPVTSLRAPLGLVMDTRTSKTSPTFSFSPIPNADFYQLRIDDVTTNTSFVVSDIAVLTSPWTITKSLTPGDTYRWSVRGYSDQGVMGPWSTTQTFKVPIAAPTGLSPSGNIQTLKPTFSWSPVTGLGAGHYQVQVMDLTTGTLVFNRNPVVGTSLLSPVTLKANHAYQLMVRAINVHGVAGPWAIKNFAERYNTPIGQSPTGTIFTTLPTFDWTGAAPDFKLRIFDVTTGQQVLLQTGITTNSFPLAAPLTSGHTYRWWVSAYDSNGISSAWSAPLQFTVN